MNKNIYFILLMLVALTSCNYYGKEIDYNQLQIFYKDGVTTDEAVRLRDYLIKQDFVSGTQQSVQLVKEDGTYIFREVIKPGLEVDSSLAHTFSVFAGDLSRDVFNGAPVKINTCNAKLETINTYEMLASNSIPDATNNTTQNTTDNAAQYNNEWKTYEKDNYTIQYPANWVLDDNTSGLVKFRISAPGSNANVNLVAEYLQGQQMDIDSYANLSESALRKQYPDFSVIDSADGNNANGAYKQIVYNQEIENKFVRLQQTMWIKDGSAYVMTLATRQDEADTSLLNTANSIVQSFTLK